MTDTTTIAREIERTAVRLTMMTMNGTDGTVRTDGGPLPSVGFYVGGVRSSLIIRDLDALWLDDVKSFVASVGSTNYFGVWMDKDTGTVYIDAVDHVLTENDAIRLAVLRGELAVWDIAGEREVRTYDISTGLSR